MTTKNWLKDVLLIAAVLAGCAAITAFLLSADRIQKPVSFDEYVTDGNVLKLASQIDASVDETLAEKGLETANRATDLQIFRRLSLALTGTIPSVEEIREVTNVDPDRRVDWYVSHLLEDQRTSDYLAERFSRAFVGVEEGPFLVYRRRRFARWLSEQIHANVPYDQITQSMLTANGLWTDSPQVNFYTYNIVPDSEDDTKPDPIRLAARTSRAFLGMRIDCLQCHDDFLGTMNLGSADDPVEGTQLHFHSLASFFSQVQNTFVGIDDNMDSETYQCQLLDASSEQPISASVPFDSQLVDDQEPNLRVRLANWVTHEQNRPFARAAVNRIWAIMFGRGLVNPVDSIPLDGPFSPTLKMLATEFVDNDYDLHHLIRAIALSKTFQRDSRASFDATSKHLANWSVFPMARLRPEQVAGSIIQSTSLKTIDSTAHIIDRLTKFGQQNDFVNRFGDPGEDEFVARNETIAQRLLMMNGEMVGERLNNGLASVSRIAILSPSVEKAVETIYLSVLTRLPTPAESNHFVEQLNLLDEDARNQKVIDIYWALINSTEFVWNY